MLRPALLIDKDNTVVTQLGIEQKGHRQVWIRQIPGEHQHLRIRALLTQLRERCCQPCGWTTPGGLLQHESDTRIVKTCPGR
ncbi:MAG: hypothetical protein Q4D96_11540 [Propionibacteriaceae bacterium]|nr:hypothetical protein [Propionibacteriaceae bacterium]